MARRDSPDAPLETSLANTDTDARLQAYLNEADDVSEYRYLVDGKHTKYITVGPGVVFDEPNGSDPGLERLLPPFPPGDWNVGYVVMDPETGMPVFASATRMILPAVESVWHDRIIDHLELDMVGRISQTVRIAECPGIDWQLIYKFAAFSWEIVYLERETAAYSWIEGHYIGPRFLGHVSEEGRVIGFLIERIRGRTATVRDLKACQRVLKKLHALGIKHGDINKTNFLITEDGSAVLVDFECAVKCDDQQALLVEYESLQHQLL